MIRIETTLDGSHSIGIWDDAEHCWRSVPITSAQLRCLAHAILDSESATPAPRAPLSLRVRAWLWYVWQRIAHPRTCYRPDTRVGLTAKGEEVIRVP
jgi:hypothetical protein